MKGFRIPAQPSRKESQQKVDTELQNIQMASRISQMMTQQLMQNMKGISEDLSNISVQLYELQYSFSAVKKHLNLDDEVINSIANNQRLQDFEEASAKADSKEGLLPSDAVDINSTITITSEAKDEEGNDRSIFRSRIKLSESGVPEMIANLTGKKVGEKLIVKLNGINHSVELLGIKNPTSEIPPEEIH